MASLIEALLFVGNFVKSVFAYALFGWSKTAYLGNLKPSKGKRVLPYKFLSDQTIVVALNNLFDGKEALELLSNDALLKICRQLEFFYTELKMTSEQEMISLAQCLIDQSIWYRPLVDRTKSLSPNSKLLELKVPKVRFGKTNLQMPVLTCGGMRLQNTWCPDSIPVISPNRQVVLNSPPQKNIKDCIRYCMALGLNHFETARMYGTSEYQMIQALYELIEEGEIKREDFIFQTKVVVQNTAKGFLELFDQTWANVHKKLGYIDLFSLHAIADVDEKLEICLEISQRLKKEGKIRHIGFSTHGTSEQIMALLNTESFDYVNLHEHFFGSYHGSGTPDTMGGEGNLACVKRALELDMGVFNISPCDKGGKLYRPSKDCAALIGQELTPIGFALLYGWKTVGFHTASIGIARPSDLDEVMGAARMLALSNQSEEAKYEIDGLLEKATDRLNQRAIEKLGKDWTEMGLLNLPGPFEESTDGIALGHTLWLYNLLVSYGMYEFCHDRYQSLVNAKWNKKKSFKENVDAM